MAAMSGNAGQAAGDAGALIALAACLRRHDDDVDFIETGAQGAVQSTTVQHERDAAQPGMARETREHGFGHLRYAAGIDEARCLDPSQTGCERALDQGDLVAR